MSDENITITARLVDEMTSGVAAVRTQIESLAATTAKLDAAGAAAAGGGLTKVSKSMADLDKLGKSVGSSMTDFADRIGAKLEEAAKRGAEALGLLGVAAVGFGLKTAAAMGQSRLALDTFTGSTLAGGKAFEALSKLVGPATFGQLTQGFQSLSLAGASTESDIRMMQALTNISAVQQAPGQSFDALSQAVNRIQETGKVEARSMLAFISNGVDIYGLLSKDLGVPRDEVKKRLSSGADVTVTPSLLTGIEAMGEAGGKFGGALEKYRATFGGQMDTIKTEASKALAVMVTPITDLVSKEGPKLTQWLTDTQGRMKDMGGLLGKEWGSGDMGGFSTTLDAILGGHGNLAPVIDSTATAVQGFGRILKNDILPLGKDLLAIAIPAMRALGDVLGFLGEHKGIVEALIVTFGGFIVFEKVAGSVMMLAKAIDVLTASSAAAGASGAAGALVKSALGIEAAAGAGPAATAASGAMGAAAMGALPLIAATAGAHAAEGAIGSHGPGGARPKDKQGAWWNPFSSYAPAAHGSLLDKLGLGSGSSAAPVTVNVHPGAIVVSGAGDPKAVANQVVKSVADQVEAAQKAAAQRGGPTIPAPGAPPGGPV